MKLKKILSGAICLLLLLSTVSDSVAASSLNQSASGEIVAFTNSPEEAALIAKEHGWKLKSCFGGVAVFCAEDADTFLRAPQSAEDQARYHYSRNRVYDILEADTPVLSTSQRGYHHAEIFNDAAWKVTKGSGAVVAVVDTGVDTDHPEFTDRISPRSYNSYTDHVGIEYVNDDHGHGTHVSGIIAASDVYGMDVCGVAPEAELLIVKADRPSDHRFDLASLLRGINYAIQEQADVINLSLGVSYFNGVNEAEHTVIAKAVQNGITVVCAAGNSSESHACYPAAYPETIAVSATQEGYGFALSYSNYGPEIDLAAPGSEIVSTWVDGSYAISSGTSMAAPVVVGTVALLHSLHPELTPQQIKERLCDTAAEAGQLGRDDLMGHGIVNAGAVTAAPEQLLTVIYDLNMRDSEVFCSRFLSGSQLIEPYAPVRKPFQFEGWFDQADGGQRVDFTRPLTENTTLFAHWTADPQQTGSSLSGVVRSFHPEYPCHIHLIKDGIVWYSTMIPSSDGIGVQEDSFAFQDITPGVYQLEVVKKGQLSYVIRNVSIGDGPLDLSKEQGKPYQVIELIGGDVNEDGTINMSDLNEIWNQTNFQKDQASAINPLTDVNGDGVVNQTDLEYVRQENIYHKTSDTDCTWLYEPEERTSI